MLLKRRSSATENQPMQWAPFALLALEPIKLSLAGKFIYLSFVCLAYNIIYPPLKILLHTRTNVTSVRSSVWC